MSGYYYKKDSFRLEDLKNGTGQTWKPLRGETHSHKPFLLGPLVTNGVLDIVVRSRPGRVTNPVYIMFARNEDELLTEGETFLGQVEDPETGDTLNIGYRKWWK